MSLPLTPLNFVVDTLLSQGLHILAGSPKVGKSWLALWLSVMVAKGEAVWGMSVQQGTTPVSYTHLDVYKRQVHSQIPTVPSAVGPSLRYSLSLFSK